MKKAPGKAHRQGISIIDLMDLFPDEDTATKWFETQVWPTGRCCGHCGGINTREVPNSKPMPYWCTDCRSYFSVRTGTAIARSKIPLRQMGASPSTCACEPQERVEHVAPPGSEDHAEVRVVHAPPAARGMGEGNMERSTPVRSRWTRRTWVERRATRLRPGGRR